MDFVSHVAGLFFWQGDLLSLWSQLLYGCLDVLTLMTKGDHIKDTTGGSRTTTIKLPSENNGTAMVFRTFDRVSYALLLEIRSGVRVGDRLVNPQE